jgi:hypothetical protein
VDEALELFGGIEKEGGCMWVGSGSGGGGGSIGVGDEEDNEMGSGRCVDRVSSECSEMDWIVDDSECDSYNSMKGKCFFNGDDQSGEFPVRCWDVADVVTYNFLILFMSILFVECVDCTFFEMLCFLSLFIGFLSVKLDIFCCRM